MTFPRPAGVSWLCGFAILAALIDLCLAQLAFWDADDLDTRTWVAAHPVGARVQLGVTYFYAAASLLTCYFMLHAKNWARWTYIFITSGRYVSAFVLLAFADVEEDFIFLRFRGAMIPGLLLVIMAFLVLFTRNARDYFAAGGRPLWRVQEEEDEREERSRK
jgi:hypothetical protein